MENKIPIKTKESPKFEKKDNLPIISEKSTDEKEPSISENIGFNSFFTLADKESLDIENENIFENNEKSKEKDKEKDKDSDKERGKKIEKEDFENKISIDLSDVNNKNLHNFLNEDLIDAIDKSLDDPIDSQCISSELSPNENDTNYSQNNISNDKDIFNNCNNINNYFFYTNNIYINNIHNTISFFPKSNKNKEEISINTNTNNNSNISENKDEKGKEIKKLVDYFDGGNPLDAPVYIPQKYKSLKFNQKPNINMENSDEKKWTDNNIQIDKKEGKFKKPFEIREGDWACKFCYNLNFAFRTKCNRCGIGKDFPQIKQK